MRGRRQRVSSSYPCDCFYFRRDFSVFAQQPTRRESSNGGERQKNNSRKPGEKIKQTHKNPSGSGCFCECVCVSVCVWHYLFQHVPTQSVEFCCLNRGTDSQQTRQWKLKRRPEHTVRRANGLPLSVFFL